MSESYYIDGMTCGGCVSKVQQVFEDLEGVEEVSVQLAAPQLQLIKGVIPELSLVGENLAAVGKYQISASPMASTLPPMPAIGKAKKAD